MNDLLVGDTVRRVSDGPGGKVGRIERLGFDGPTQIAWIAWPDVANPSPVSIGMLERGTLKSEEEDDEEKQAAKKRYFADYFDALDLRVDVTARLQAEGHRHEAMLLCCCYIEGLGNFLSAEESKGSLQNFCEILAAHGADVFRLLFPCRVEAFPGKSQNRDVKQELIVAFGKLPAGEAFEMDELRKRLAPMLSAEAIRFFDAQAWRVTGAAIVYDRLRSKLVHYLSSAPVFSFRSVTHQGAALPEVGFAVLHAALVRIAEHARTISVEKGEWYGQV